MRIDFSSAWNSGARIINNAIALLPNAILALIGFGCFLLLASLVRSLVQRLVLHRRRHKNLALLLGQVVYVLTLFLGSLIALSIVAPSFQASNLIQVLGIGSVAIGFAFQNILQNFLAGILLLLQEPFGLDDWINVTGLEGRVTDIQMRATVVNTVDGRRVVIPNAVLFTNPVTVGSPPGSAAKNTPIPQEDLAAHL